MSDGERIFLVERYREHSKEWAPVPSGWVLYTHHQAIHYIQTQQRQLPGHYRVVVFRRDDTQEVGK